MKKIIVFLIAAFILSFSVTSIANALTTNEALMVLDSASSQAALTRKDHQLVIESINLLRSRLKEVNEKSKVKEKKKEVETQPVGMPEE